MGAVGTKSRSFLWSLLRVLLLLLLLLLRVLLLLLLLLLLQLQLLESAARCAAWPRLAGPILSCPASLSFPLPAILPLRLHIGSPRLSFRRELLQLLFRLLARLCAFLQRCACWIRRQSDQPSSSHLISSHLIERRQLRAEVCTWSGLCHCLQLS